MIATLGRMTQGWDGEAFLHGSEVTPQMRLAMCGIGGAILFVTVHALFFPRKGPPISEWDPFGILIGLGLIAIGPLLCLSGMIWRSTYLRVSRGRIEVESANLFDVFAATYGPQDVLWMRLRGFTGRNKWAGEVSWRLTLATDDGRKHDTLLFKDRQEALDVKAEMERSFFGPRGGSFAEPTADQRFRDGFR